MLAKFTALFQNRPNSLQWPDTDLTLLPAKMSKRMWVDPTQFLTLVHALSLAHWSLSVVQSWHPALPPPARRGRKQVYQDSSIIVMALVHVAWQMSY